MVVAWRRVARRGLSWPAVWVVPGGWWWGVWDSSGGGRRHLLRWRPRVFAAGVGFDSDAWLRVDVLLAALGGCLTTAGVGVTAAAMALACGGECLCPRLWHSSGLCCCPRGWSRRVRRRRPSPHPCATAWPGRRRRWFRCLRLPMGAVGCARAPTGRARPMAAVVFPPPPPIPLVSAPCHGAGPLWVLGRLRGRRGRQRRGVPRAGAVAGAASGRWRWVAAGGTRRWAQLCGRLGAVGRGRWVQLCGSSRRGDRLGGRRCGCLLYTCHGWHVVVKMLPPSVGGDVFCSSPAAHSTLSSEPFCSPSSTPPSNHRHSADHPRHGHLPIRDHPPSCPPSSWVRAARSSWPLPP